MLDAGLDPLSEVPDARSMRCAPCFLQTLCLLALPLAMGCAPALPTLSGGRTTPNNRTDLALGGAVRVPVGDLVAQPGVEADRLLAASASGGAVPVAMVRRGVSPDVDLGVETAGTTLRLSARGRVRLGMFNLVAGLVPHVGLVDDPIEAGRLGVSIPVVLSLDVLSVAEAWLGVRGTLEHAFGELEGAALTVTGVRGGGVLGLAVGFRRFHVLLELGIDYERWFGALGDTEIEREGVVLTPAFAVRLRL
ncbi:MAG: hypothetical protein AB8I08_05535 [Sandaracinaceae bacterium]